MTKKGMKIHEPRYLKGRSLARAFKKANLAGLLKDRNIIGAGFGRRIAHDQITDEPALVVYVARKVPRKFLPPSRLLPRKFFVGGDCLDVDVVQTGPLYPQAFTARLRPAPAGCSVSHLNVTAGTLGSIVIDNTDRSICILSNNHVIADQNAAAIGDEIVQPGTFDGGTAPADTIARLKRFVMINATGNTVDGAIAEASSKDVIDEVINQLIPVAGPDHPAIGLLFAGSCNRTIINPIADVLAQLNVSFPAGAGATATADIGMNVEKVGRTTEYTTSTVKEIDATVTIGYDFGDATFDNQIVTGKLSEGGDSGSLVYQGGAGGDLDECGSCGTSTAAEEFLQTNLQAERSMADEVREKFLRHTRIGKFAIDLFFAVEDRAIDRFRASRIEADDRDFARKMFDKYVDDARQAFVEGERSERTITEQHVRDAQTALKRAHKYLEQDEIEASERLFALGKKVAVGKTPRELLVLLNNENLLDDVKQIIATVDFLKGGGRGCC